MKLYTFILYTCSSANDRHIGVMNKINRKTEDMSNRAT